MKTVYVVHGWGGSPEEEIHMWLKHELESRGYKVVIPAMPHTDHPTIEEWVGTLNKIIQNPDKETILVGHSIGCQTILRYLGQLPLEIKIGGTVLLAPWFTLTNLEPEEEEIRKPWTDTPVAALDSDITRHQEKMIAIFSDNDPVVPLENAEAFKKRFNAEVIIEHNKGHYTMEDNISSVPSVLEAVLSFKF